MCSVNDNDLNDEIALLEHSETIEISDGVLCQKCNENDALIKLRGKDVYCKSCFQIIVTHKFRATLGKSKIVRTNDKILVAHSGNGKSLALLHLIKAGMHESVHKRLIFQTQIIYIDDGMINNKTVDERQSTIEEIKRQILSFEFETFVVSLSESINEKNIDKVEIIEDYICATNNSNDDQLIEIFNNLKSNTSREDLLNKLRLKIIVKIAKLLGCQKIFFADDSMSLSISILTNVSLGRGAQLSLDVGFTDNRYGNDLIIMRPLRDFTRQEVNYYLNLHNLTAINSKKLTSNSNGSIRQLTERFITDLDSQFNSTVSTIFRVSEKVSAIMPNLVEKTEKCILCYAPLDTSDISHTTTAIKSIEFSKFISSGNTEDITDNKIINNITENLNKTTQIPQAVNSCGNCVDKTDCIKKKTNNISSEEIILSLCYGCRLIFNDNYNHKLLPNFLLNTAKEELCLINMRNQISNFLL